LLQTITLESNNVILQAPGAAPIAQAMSFPKVVKGREVTVRTNRSFQVAWLLAPFWMGLNLAGCATSEKIQAKQIADRELSCEQLVTEQRKLEEAAGKVDANRGVTGTNVVSTLFWLPGLAYTYYDAGEADRLISERRSWLTELHEEKECSKRR
jgi:hypothetical protein